MESLYLLIPLSAGLVLVILAIFGWAVQRGQFEDLDDEGVRILNDESPSLDADQARSTPALEESQQRILLTK
jgi:cbb3-type cytochrome oxidase maturation protein